MAACMPFCLNNARRVPGQKRWHAKWSCSKAFPYIDSLRPVFNYRYRVFLSSLTYRGAMQELPFFNQAFAQVLRARREEMRMTQMGCAVAIGGSEVAVRRMERGVQTPTTTTLILLARALEMTPTDFLDCVLKRMEFLENSRQMEAPREEDGLPGMTP